MPIRCRPLLAGCAFCLLLPIIGRATGPDELTPEQQLQAGGAFVTQARYRDALRAYEQARATGGDALKYRASVGIVKTLLRTTGFARVRAEAAALRDLAPTDATAVALHGDALWVNALFDEAEQSYRRAVALDPDAARGRHGLARSLAARNRLPEALAEAESALRLDPQERDYHHTVGAVYTRMRQYDAAVEAFNAYLLMLPKKDPSGASILAKESIRFLRSFRGRVPFEAVGHAQQVHVVPFKVVRDKVLVQARVNGSSIDMVVDTGAEMTVLSRRGAARAGVSAIASTVSAGVGEVGLRGLQLGRIDLLQVGTLKMKNVSCLIKNPALAAAFSADADSFSPLALGMSMTIDYGRRQLIIGAHLPPEPAATELGLHMHRLAMVRGTLNGDHPTSFIVDTGGEVISISSSMADVLGPNPFRRIPVKVYGNSGLDRDAFLLPGVTLAFDEIRFEKLPVIVLNLHAPSALLGFQVGGIVGHRFLSKYRVQLDLERSTMRLSPLS